MADFGSVAEDKTAVLTATAQFGAKADYNLILNTFPPAITSPTASPFVLKLETYLRIAGIKYTIDTRKPFGAKGKTPWITFNGKHIDDSEIIIDFLNKALNKNLWGNATLEEKAAAQGMRIMLENHTLLGLAEWRWIEDLDNITKILAVSGIKLWGMKKVAGRRVKGQLNDNGFTRHTPEERMKMIRKDFTAISDYLGEKAYFLGNDATEIDATVFGVLGQFLYVAPGSPYQKMLNDEYKNLKAYCERVKGRFWPEWDSLLHKK